MKRIGLAWFACGIAAGAAAGLLYAPRKGVRTRARIASKTKQARRLLRSGGAVLERLAALSMRRARSRSQPAPRPVFHASIAKPGAFLG